MTAITLSLPTSTKFNVKSIKQATAKSVTRSFSVPMPSNTEMTSSSESSETRISEILPEFGTLFRTSSNADTNEEMWTLKRASPVFDDESDDECLESPSKRIRSTYFLPLPDDSSLEMSNGQKLSWEFRIRESENGFDVFQ
jgi:hypothetical protein